MCPLFDKRAELDLRLTNNISVWTGFVSCCYDVMISALTWYFFLCKKKILMRNLKHKPNWKLSVCCYKVYVTFATFATLGKIDWIKQGLLVIPSSQG